MSTFTFINNHTFETRVSESARIIKKYPDRIPVIIERSVDSDDIPDIDKKKYLVPIDLTVGQFVYVIRKRIKLSPEKAIFLHVFNADGVVSDSMPPTSELMRVIFKENTNEDGFLYMTYGGEKTFG